MHLIGLCSAQGTSRSTASPAASPPEGVRDGVEGAGVADPRAGVEGLQVQLPAASARAIGWSLAWRRVRLYDGIPIGGARMWSSTCSPAAAGLRGKM